MGLFEKLDISKSWENHDTGPIKFLYSKYILVELVPASETHEAFQDSGQVREKHTQSHRLIWHFKSL